MTFGQHLRKRREALRIPLSRFCVENGFDPSHVSKIERGILPPPSDPARIARFARAVGLRPGMKEWARFHERALAGAGGLPADDDLVGKLPVILRGPHSGPTGEAHLQAIRKIIRAS
jgi:transcriptional regulator with XRE-family HTH domain